MRIFLQLRFKRFRVEVRANDFSGIGKPHAVNQARVIQRVGEYQIFFLQQRGQQAKIRHVPAAKIQCRFRPRELRRLFFELLPNREVPESNREPVPPTILASRTERATASFSAGCLDNSK